MKSRMMIISVIFIFQTTDGLGQAGFEQYYYLQEKEAMVLVPVVHFNSATNWYAEARYNYEEQNSFSLYGGKRFAKTKNAWACSLTPVLGGIIGRFRGGSVGLNTLLEYNRFFFSSQSQFVFSARDNSHFFYDWSEAGYEALPWLYMGYSIQHKIYTQLNINSIECGVVLGFAFGKWKFPLYSFNTLRADRYFVVGINHGIGATETNH